MIEALSHRKSKVGKSGQGKDNTIYSGYGGLGEYKMLWLNGWGTRIRRPFP